MVQGIITPEYECASNTVRLPIKVAVVENRRKLREILRELICSLEEFNCVCSCASAEEALRMVPTVAPDIILMDILLPGMSGIECTIQLKKLLPNALVLVLTNVDDDQRVFMAFRAGADGYLLKTAKPKELGQALLDLKDGGAPMSSEIARRVVNSFRKTTNAFPASGVVRHSNAGRANR